MRCQFNPFTGFFYVEHQGRYLSGLTRQGIHELREELSRTLMKTDPVMESRREGSPALREEGK